MFLWESDSEIDLIEAQLEIEFRRLQIPFESTVSICIGNNDNDTVNE